MQIVCFEDDPVQRLCPIVHARPAMSIRCGSFSLSDWLVRLADETPGGKLGAFVRSFLKDGVTQDIGLSEPTTTSLADADGCLLVNARLVPSVANYQALKKLAASKKVCRIVDQADRSVVLAIRWPAESIATMVPPANDWLALINAVKVNVAGDSQTAQSFHWPHEVVSWHQESLTDSLQWRIQTGDYEQRRDGVFVSPGVVIGDMNSFDTSDGPIVLEQNARTGPFCFLKGPIHLGADSRTNEHASIKHGVAVGHHVKLGGEVEASIIEPYSNKQHHGFLGHSYLGSWINLGAGTCNSDLKNTYGKINVRYGDTKVATDMQFMGCVIGDYTKSAINTSIFTGKIIGVGSMLYGFVTENVPGFTNHMGTLGESTSVPLEVMLATQARMFARRNLTPRPCDIALMKAMFEQAS